MDDETAIREQNEAMDEAIGEAFRQCVGWDLDYRWTGNQSIIS